MARRREQTTLARVGEFGFLRRLLDRLPVGAGVMVGPGDDCAVVEAGSRRILITTDALVDEVHFRRSWMSSRQLGRKAYLVNASDIAAMGGRPRFCVISIGVPPDFPVRDLSEIHRGIAVAASETGASVVGGNLARADALFVSLTLIGDAPRRPLRRRGARPGDALFVTGDLGQAALGLRRLLRNDRERGPAVRRFCEPIPRLTAGAMLTRHRLASAAIDISDGLLQDLGHLCEASGVGARVEAELLPCRAVVRAAGDALALTGGEDYELLCAVPAENLARVERLKSRFGCRFTRIGQLMAIGDGIQVVDRHGKPMTLTRTGFDHFSRGGRS